MRFYFLIFVPFLYSCELQKNSPSTPKVPSLAIEEEIEKTTQDQPTVSIEKKPAVLVKDQPTVSIEKKPALLVKDQPSVSLEKKILLFVEEKTTGENPDVSFNGVDTKLRGAYSKNLCSTVFAKKAIEIEIDGKKHQKIHLASTGHEITLPVHKSFKSGRKIVIILLTVDGKVTQSHFDLKIGPAQTDLLLGQNFMIDNFFKD